ncbi:MAG: SRPBCC family protein [Gordonia sp. (in: high G+C Gram-positive bacteria)]
MARSYDLEPIGLDFFDTAPVTYTIDVHLPVTPQRAWAELTRQHTLNWCRAIRSVEFLSARPYGVGTTRRVRLGPGVTLSEYYFDWLDETDNDHYRNAFHVTQASIPGIRGFGELTEVAPAAIGCRLVWRFAAELAASARATALFAGPTSPVFKSIETDTIRYFATLSPQT